MEDNLVADKVGFLSKKGLKRHTWKTRWCVLYIAQGRIDYYVDSTDVGKGGTGDNKEDDGDSGHVRLGRLWLGRAQDEEGGSGECARLITDVIKGEKTGQVKKQYISYKLFLFLTR